MPRPTNHLLLLWSLNDVANDIHTAQELIDNSRRLAPTNGMHQLHLDRTQAELDERRAIVERLYIDIPMRN